MTEIDEATPLYTYIFTFGYDHMHPVTGEPLRNRYLAVTAASGNHARALVLNHFDNNWSFQYNSAKAAGVDRFLLVLLPYEDWPPCTGTWRVVDGAVVDDAMINAGEM
jgi:hypothetical protein